MSEPKSNNRYVFVLILALLTAGILARIVTRRDEPSDPASAAASAPAGDGKPALAAPGAAGRTFFAGPGGPTRTAVPKVVKVADALHGAILGTVLDPAGQPLEGAQVLAKREAAEGERPDPSRRASPGASTATARDGTYRLAGLDDGTYSVQARAAGLRSEPLPGVAVRSGEEVRNVDFILDTGERITGTVYDPDGKPLEGATVEARALAAAVSIRGSKAVTSEVEASTRTASDGSFDLGGLASGRKSVIATGKGFRRSEPVLVELHPGDAPRVELRLSTGVFVAGRVTQGDEKAGEPARGVRVEVRAEQGGGPPMMGQGGQRPDEVLSATTDDDGKYRVEGLAGRRFRVVAWPEDPSLAPGVRGGVNANDEHADIHLEPGAGIYGTVVLAGASGGAEKQGVDGATVTIGDALTRKSVTTDGAGRFEISPVPAGKHDIRASAQGKAEAQLSVAVKAGERKEVVIELAPGCTIEGKVFAMQGGAPLAGATVRAIDMREQQGGGGGGAQGGRGGRRGGGPGAFGAGQAGGNMGRSFMEEAGVEAVASGADLSEMIPEAELARVQSRNASTDAAGRFVIGDLPAGEWRVYAAHPDYPGNGAACRLDKPGDTAKVEIGLPEGGAIAGHVRAQDGAPRPDEQVMAFSFAGRPRLGRTDEKGNYKLRGVAPGSYFVMLSPNLAQGGGGGRRGMNMAQVLGGLNFESKQASVEAGRTTEVNFGDEVKVVLFGQVVRSGEPVQGAMLTFLPDGGMAGFKAAGTDAEGRYEAELIPGKYVLRIENLSENVEVAVGAKRVQHDVRLSVGSISGKVVNAATSEPLRGARVQIYKGERKGEVESMAGALGAMAGDTRVREDGSFSVGGLAPGLYTVTGQGDGFARARVDGIEVPPDGERSGIELACEPGGVLRGRVLDDTRAPVAGAAIVAVEAAAADLGGGGDPPRTDQDGAFEVKRFAPGRYRVSVINETLAPWRAFLEINGQAEIAPVMVTGGLLEVTVLGEEGRPVPGASVDFRYPEGDRVITGFMDFLQSSTPVPLDGKVRKGRLPPGTIKVVARVEIPGLPAQEGFADAVIRDRDESHVTVIVHGPQ